MISFINYYLVYSLGLPNDIPGSLEFGYIMNNFYYQAIFYCICYTFLWEPLFEIMPIFHIYNDRFIPFPSFILNIDEFRFCKRIYRYILFLNKMPHPKRNASMMSSNRCRSAITVIAFNGDCYSIGVYAYSMPQF